MDLQVDNMSIFKPHDFPKLREGERVEVRQKDVGLRGSWHPGTVVGRKAGRRLVEYDELLTDDGLSKLRESIPCSKLNDKLGICFPPTKSHGLVVTPTWSPSKRRGLLRPCPPPRTEPLPLTWKGGLFVDVFYQDAWWEAVLLNDVASLDDGALVDVIFPDEGDLARVLVKDMRVSQCWDEVTGNWSIKGSIDLAKFLKQRGIEKKEVSLTADSDCRASDVCNSLTGDEVKSNKIEWIQTCSSLVSNIKSEDTLTSVIQVPSSPKAVSDKWSEDLSPSSSHEHLKLKRSKAEESRAQTILPSRNGSPILDLPDCRLEIPSSSGGIGKVSCEKLQHPEISHSGLLFDNDTEALEPAKGLVNRDGVAECRRCEGTEPFGLRRETAEKEFIQGSVVFKRRKIGKALPNSYEREAKFLDPQLGLPSFLNESCTPTHEELTSGIGECLQRGTTAYKGAIHSRELSNLRGWNERSSAMVVKETDMGLSIGFDGGNLLSTQLSTSPPTGNLDRRNRHNKGSKLSQTRPVRKMYLLALEAPVCKSQEEYKQIISAGEAALGGGASSGKHRGKNVSGWESQEKDRAITLAGEKKLEAGMLGMVMRPRTESGKETQNATENYGQSSTAEESRWGAASRLGEKAGEASAQEPIKEDLMTLAGKATLKCNAYERNLRIKKQAGESLRSGGTSERRVGNDTLRSFREHLVRQKQVKALKRKASNLSSELEESGKNVKLPKISKPDTQLVRSTTSSLCNSEDSSAVKRKAHKRIRVLIASNPAETASASSLSNSKGRNAVKGKTQCGSKAKCSSTSKPERKLETVTASGLSNLEVKKNTNLKSLKKLASEVGKTAVLEAGFTIDYRPRRGHLSFDAVYTSPKGHSYWSLPKAWQALGKENKKGLVKVEKAVIQQVLSKIDEDEKLRTAFERLDKFAGMCLEEVMNKANLTYAELTDVLIEDLHILRKNVQKTKGKKGMVKGRPTKEKKSGRKTPNNADSLLASGSLLVKKRGRKPTQRVSGAVDCKASTSKVYSRLKNMQGSSFPEHLKSRSSIEGTSRMSHTPVDSSKALVKLGSHITDISNEKRQNNPKGLLKNSGYGEPNSRKESSEKKEKPRSGLRLEVRPPSSCMDDVSEDLSCQSTRTVVSWMIGSGAVLETESFLYVDEVSNEVLKEGVLTREGILCRCCKRVYTVNGFKEHGRSREKRPHCNLRFASGKTFLDCQLKAWKTEIHLRRTQNYKGVSANDTNDDTCLLCGDGGMLLCCDFCPSTFHASCLQIENVPEGNWYCPKCRCGVCKGTQGIEEEAFCSQCERRYHIACMQGRPTIFREQFLCRESCKKIYSGLKNLIGITHPLGKGFLWSLLHCVEEPQTENFKTVMENNSKLAVALLVLKECFNPMDDPRTNIDMITHAAYNRGSQFCRLNYVGFYTVVLERDDEIISVASIRIHGARVAEMPLIGTRHKYRRQGMCRLLVRAIEKLLMSLEVATFILPAIPELYDTWTQAFGFRPLDSSLRLEIKDLSMMMFPGTDLLQKSLLGGTAVSSPSPLYLES